MAETPHPQIEVDTADDHDSVAPDDISSFTASITSSILDYPVENGRRYHAFRSGVYCLPNDEPEQERLDLAHLIMTKSLSDKLFLTPIDTDKVHRVLDLGTGTGIWSMAMGDEYPNAEVLGNDLSPIQPPWVPPNVKFEVDDVESPWLYDNPFDFIFCRYMACCIQDWPTLVKRAYDNLNPGGWVEFQDFDLNYYEPGGSLIPESDTRMWSTMLLDAARKIGRDPCPGVSLEAWVRDAGFTNVKHQKIPIPIGSWPRDPKLKEIGKYNYVQVLSGLEAFTLRLFCDVLGWSKPEVTVLLAKVRNEFKSGKFNALFNFHVVYGQKPPKEQD
ncbi:hypothetical protein VTI74DRAFT_2356 [Chaetomium olivicolor]